MQSASSRRRGRRPSTSPGRSRRCAPTRRLPGRARFTPKRSSAASGWQRMPPSSSQPGTRALTHCNAGGLATGGLRHRGRRAPDGVGARPSRARARRRDAAAPSGRPPHRLGARDGRDPAHRDRRQRRRVDDGARRGRPARHRRRPHRRERRHREQDRHVLARRARAPSRHPALRRRADLDGRPRNRDRRRHPDRGARLRRDLGPLHRTEPRLRRDACRPDHGDRHRERRAPPAVHLRNRSR